MLLGGEVADGASYPDGLKTHLHHTKAWLPVPVARALRTNPELVQRAVEGFYVRDPSQLRVSCNKCGFSATLLARPIDLNTIPSPLLWVPC
jgi:hypothetical protein